MIINIVLNFDGTIRIDIEEGNHLPRWVDHLLGRALHGRIVLDRKDQIVEFIDAFSTNGNKYTEGTGLNGLFRDSIVIGNPEQLKQKFKILNENGTVDSEGRIKVTHEDFIAVKKGIAPKIHRELIEAHKEGAGAGFFSGTMPADIGKHIGSYLDIKSAGRLSKTKKSAHASAENHTKDRAIKISKSEITFEEFKTRYLEQYKKETFKNPWSAMLKMLKENKINSINQVVDYINQNPKSRAALVLKLLANEHAQEKVNRIKMKK